MGALEERILDVVDGAGYLSATKEFSHERGQVQCSV